MCITPPPCSSAKPNENTKKQRPTGQTGTILCRNQSYIYIIYIIYQSIHLKNLRYLNILRYVLPLAVWTSLFSNAESISAKQAPVLSFGDENPVITLILWMIQMLVWVSVCLDQQMVFFTPQTCFVWDAKWFLIISIYLKWISITTFLHTNDKKNSVWILKSFT